MRSRSRTVASSPRAARASTWSRSASAIVPSDAPGRPSMNDASRQAVAMQVPVLLSKIHRATVTDADLHYEGSITIDRRLMDLAGLLAFQQVQVYNVNNGARFETY